MRKAKVDLTADALRKAIEEGKPASMTQLAHRLGYKGSVSSGLTKKFRVLIPEIDALLKSTTPTGTPSTDGKAVTAKTKPAKAAKSGAKQLKANPVGAKTGKWPRDPRNPFREGSSSYGICFDILAAHKSGLRRETLVALLADATGKDPKRASFDAQVVLSARGSDEPGLSRNDGPRHRSCRPGFWVERENGHVKLVVD